MKQHDGLDDDAVIGDEIEQGIQKVNTSMAPDHVHGITVKASGGNESRPRSIALLACIKY